MGVTVNTEQEQVKVVPDTYQVVVTEDGKEVSRSTRSLSAGEVEETANATVASLAMEDHQRLRKMPSIIYEDRGGEIPGVFAVVGRREVHVEQE